MKKQGKSSPRSGVGMMMIIIILVLAHLSIAAIATSANNNNGTIISTHFQRRVLAQVQSKTQQTFNPKNAAFKASKSGLYYYGSSPKNPAGGSSHCNPYNQCRSS
ncbi:hypothetical protein S83_048958 [Arachis hypogaea]|nr:uncharacterized protein DS421_14g487500 [Arachis hypogaea]